MRSLVGVRLPKFTQKQSDMLKGSYDFLGVNYYTARYVDQSTSYSYENQSYTTDCRCNTTSKDITVYLYLGIYIMGLEYNLCSWMFWVFSQLKKMGFRSANRFVLVICTSHTEIVGWLYTLSVIDYSVSICRLQQIGCSYTRRESESCCTM